MSGLVCHITSRQLLAFRSRQLFAFRSYSRKTGGVSAPAPSGARVKLVHKTEPWGAGLVNIHSFLFVFQVLITRISLKCNKQCGLFG